VLNPLVKIAFADPNLTFDFTEVRAEFAKGALREFEPAGERALISPAK
jgi:methyl-coenzyme M reductase alpha subunit